MKWVPMTCLLQCLESERSFCWYSHSTCTHRGGFRDASVSPTNEQPQRFGVSVLKDLDFAGDISWGSVLVLSQSEGDVPIDWVLRLTWRLAVFLFIYLFIFSPVVFCCFGTVVVIPGERAAGNADSSELEQPEGPCYSNALLGSNCAQRNSCAPCRQLLRSALAWWLHYVRSCNLPVVTLKRKMCPSRILSGLKAITTVLWPR